VTRRAYVLLVIAGMSLVLVIGIRPMGFDLGRVDFGYDLTGGRIYLAFGFSQ
jgi:hypothetical protein